jgi:hypothetical protein
MFQQVSSFLFLFKERYFAIIHPLRAKYICTKRRARNIIIIIWALSFLAAVPVLFGKVNKF